MICWCARIFQCAMVGCCRHCRSGIYIPGYSTCAVALVTQCLKDWPVWFSWGIQVFMAQPLQVISPNVIEVWEERGWRWVKVMGTACLEKPIGFHWKVPGKWLSNIEQPYWQKSHWMIWSRKPYFCLLWDSSSCSDGNVARECHQLCQHVIANLGCELYKFQLWLRFNLTSGQFPKNRCSEMLPGWRVSSLSCAPFGMEYIYIIKYIYIHI